MPPDASLQVFSLPPSTPVTGVYPNLAASSQHARNNFRPQPRKFKRVVSAQENEAALRRTLRTHWGHESFRGPQLDICLDVMRGCDVLVVAPTGLGKSVCFQVPAVTLPFGITLVISPLLALMEDQVASLKDRGIQAAMLCEKTPHAEVQEIKRQLSMGHPEVRILYVTPETLFSKKYEHQFRLAYRQKQLVRLVVDEAHVLDEWGMTFRPAYRQLGEFRQMFPDIPVSALTASATEDVRNRIIDTLGMRRSNLAQRVEPFNRKNLFYEIRYRGNVLEHEDKEHEIANFIIAYREEARKRNIENGIKTPCVSGLVYCRSRAACSDLVHKLAARRITARPFHAMLPVEQKKQTLTDWQAGKVECIVATIAFGMGIDAPHVRYVIHWDMPKSFEGYYQETGRAGRDGHASRCVLFYSREDAATLRTFIEREAQKAQRAQEKETDLDGLDADKSEQDAGKIRQLNSFKRLQQYAESVKTCRHVSICGYFGETIDGADEDIRKAYCHGMCDVCVSQSTVLRRACTISEEVPVASQVVTLPARPHQPSDGTWPSSDNPLVECSLFQIHPTAVAVSHPKENAPLSLGEPSVSTPVPPQDEPLVHEGDIYGLEPSNVGPNVEHSSQSAAPVTHSVSGRSKSSSSPTEKGYSEDHCIVDADEVAPAHSSPVVHSPQPRKKKRKSSEERSRSRAPAVPPSLASLMNRPVRPSPLRPTSKINTPDRARAATIQMPSRKDDPFSFVPITGADEGTYATPDAVSPRKKKKQLEAFRKIEPIIGEGPFPVYNVSTPLTARKTQPARSTFKVPFAQSPVVGRVGQILMPDRDKAKAALQQALEFTFKRTLTGREVWEHWGRSEAGKDRVGMLVKIASALEEDVVHTTLTKKDFEKKIESVCAVIRVLSHPQISDLVKAGRLERHFEGSSQLPWIRLVEKVVKKTKIA